MTINLDLNDEQTAAMRELTAEYNQRTGHPVTDQEYLSRVLIDAINDRVRRNFRAVVEQLGEAAETLPLSKRLALVATVQAAIAEG